MARRGRRFVTRKFLAASSLTRACRSERRHEMNATLWTADPRVIVIMRYVRWFRGSKGIIPTPGVKFELSCEVHGEFWSLVTRQLVNTTEFDGGWLELRAGDGGVSEPVVIGVLQEILHQLTLARTSKTSAILDPDALSIEAAVEGALMTPSARRVRAVAH